MLRCPRKSGEFSSRAWGPPQCWAGHTGAKWSRCAPGMEAFPRSDPFFLLGRGRGGLTGQSCCLRWPRGEREQAPKEPGLVRAQGVEVELGKGSHPEWRPRWG